MFMISPIYDKMNLFIIIFLILIEVFAAIQLSTTRTKSKQIKEYLLINRLEDSSSFHIKDPDQSLINYGNFDRCVTMPLNSVESSSSESLLTNQFNDQLIPIDLPHKTQIAQDVCRLNKLMLTYSEPSDTSLIVRLALMSDVRCSLWHEDYVKLRLVKTYYGIGTQWCDPYNKNIRAINYISKLTNIPLHVNDKDINHLQSGDVLVMSGRNHPPYIPILHRSPPIDADTGMTNHKRLLLSITLS